MDAAVDDATRSLRETTMAAFAAMYEARHLRPELFDVRDGYLQTSLSDDDRMPLQFFVDYNNCWWFPILRGVAVPSAAYDARTDTGVIALDIDYGDDHVLRATQLVRFTGDRIGYIRTYLSPAFFTSAYAPVRLDTCGNDIWLSSGYDFAWSCRAARLFFDSPRGRGFVTDPLTSAATTAIRANLDGFGDG